MSKRGKSSNLVWVGLIVGVVAVLAVLVPPYLSARSRGSQETVCRSNLKNIGTAFEMYSTDWSGKYPSTLSLLTPNYLKTIPECPVTGTMTYRMVEGPNVGYNRAEKGPDGKLTQPFLDYYLVWCEGEQHNKAYGTPVNYPQYDGIAGLIDY